MLKNKFDYNNAKFERIKCNLCGQNNFFILSEKSANGLNTRTCLCKNCGFIYINPRMTRLEYNEYYKYHRYKSRAKIKGIKPFETGNGFENSKKFGRVLANKLQKYIVKGLTLDVGSGTGGILLGLKEILSNIEVVGIEPSINKANYAESKGVKTYNCLFEDFKNDSVDLFSNIICVQSLNHLLNPRKFFEWSYDNLKHGGNLILAVKNFCHQTRRCSSISGAVQIDHPCMFTPETLKYFVETVGFKVIFIDIDEKKNKQELNRQRKNGMHVHHFRLVAQKIENKRIIISKPKNRKNYLKLRIKLSRIAVKFWYYVFYANKIKFIKKIIS